MGLWQPSPVWRYLRKRAPLPAAAPAAISQPINPATETDAAQPITADTGGIVQPIGVATETSSARVIAVKTASDTSLPIRAAFYYPWFTNIYGVDSAVTPGVYSGYTTQTGWFTVAADTTYDNVLFTSPGQYSVRDTVANVTFTNCTFEGNPTNEHANVRGTNWVFDGCRFTGSPGNHAIKVMAGGSVVIRNCEFVGTPTEDHVQFENHAGGNFVERNDFVGAAGEDGIDIKDSQASTTLAVRWNNFDGDMAGEGLLVQDGVNDVEVYENRFHDCFFSWGAGLTNVTGLARDNLFLGATLRLRTSTNILIDRNSFDYASTILVGLSGSSDDPTDCYFRDNKLESATTVTNNLDVSGNTAYATGNTFNTTKFAFATQSAPGWYGSSPAEPYWGAWTQGTSPWTQYHPGRGYYNSSDPIVIAEHINDMIYGGFTAGITSWWGEGSREDNATPDLFERALLDGRGFQWAIYYEMEGNTTATPGSPNPSAAQLAADLNYLTANYTSHPNYLHVNGKPVVFAFGDPTDDNTVTTDINQRPAARWHAANLLADQEWYIVLKVYAGYDTDQASFPVDSWHQYGPAAAVDVQGSYARTISPGFHRGDDAPPFLARRTRAEWQQAIRDMVAGAQDWKLVTTYNEFGEGSPVELVTGPSSADPGDNPNRVYAGTGWASPSGYGTYLDDLANNGHYLIGLGTAVETESAQPITAVVTFTAAVGPAVETDAAQPISSAASTVEPVNPATEADAAQPVVVSTSLSQPVTAAAEADVAQLVTAALTLTVAVTAAVETDAAQPISSAGSVAQPINPATETDAAQPVAAAVSVAVTSAAETDVAQPVTATLTVAIAVNPATETDAARPFSPSGSTIESVAAATETDAAQPITAVLALTQQIGAAVEVDAAQPLGTGVSSGWGSTPWGSNPWGLSGDFVAVNPAVETDAAQPVAVAAGGLQIAVGVTTETDAAQPVTAVVGGLALAVGVATETDEAVSITPDTGGIIQPVNPATEADAAQPVAAVTGGFSQAVGVTVETDAAQPVVVVVGGLQITVNTATETDEAVSVTPDTGGIIQPASTAIETDVAQPVTAVVGPVSITVSVAVETDQAITVTAGGTTPQPLAGASSSATATAAALSATKPLAGASSSATATWGRVLSGGAIASTSSSASAASGQLHAAYTLTGTSSSATAASGVAGLRRAIAAAVSSASAASGDLFAGQTVPLASASSSATAAAGIILPVVGLTSASSSATATAGSMPVARAMSSASSSATAAGGWLSNNRGLTTAASSATGFSGSLRTFKPDDGRVVQFATVAIGPPATVSV